MKSQRLRVPFLLALAVLVAGCSSQPTSNFPADEDDRPQNTPYEVVHVEVPTAASDPALVAAAVDSFASLIPEFDSYPINDCPVGTLNDLVGERPGDYGPPFSTNASTGGIGCVTTSVGVTLLEEPPFANPSAVADNFNEDSISGTAVISYYDGDLWAYCPPADYGACAVTWIANGLTIDVVMGQDESLAPGDKIQDLITWLGAHLPSMLSTLAKSGKK